MQHNEEGRDQHNVKDDFDDIGNILVSQFIHRKQKKKKKKVIGESSRQREQAKVILMYVK